jgi:hypothetical protein
LTATLAVFVLLVSAAVAHSATTKGAAKKGANWITHQPLSDYDYPGFKADAIQALTAARIAKLGIKSSETTRFIDSLEQDTDFAVTAGATGKLILAAVATGKNPRCFGPTKAAAIDLVALVRSFYDKGRYGDSNSHSAFDQGLAMLGLAAAGEKVPNKAVKFVQKRRAKFGWSFGLTTTAGDDIESTALLIEALRASGVSRTNGGVKAAFKWIRFQRNPDGGYSPSGAAQPTNANATAYAIRAADALGRNEKDAKKALRALQTSKGSFRLTPTERAAAPWLSTSDAVIALSGAHYPIVSRRSAAKSCV